MSDERRYDEAEVAEILERATLAEARALAVSSARGLRPGDGVVAAAMALVGLGQLGYIRALLPRWAAERASQMEALAERIPRLLDE